MVNCPHGARKGLLASCTSFSMVPKKTRAGQPVNSELPEQQIRFVTLGLALSGNQSMGILK